MEEDNSELRFSRRSLIRGAGVLGGVGGLAALGLSFGSQPALAAETDSLTARDISIQADQNDEIIDVWINPSGTLTWENLATPTDSEGIEQPVPLQFAIDAEVGTSSGTILDTPIDIVVSEGFHEYPASGHISLLNAAEIDRGDFPAGETTTVTITVTATIAAEDNANLAEDLIAEDTASFDVEVEEGADLGFEGELNPGGESAVDTTDGQ